MQVGVERAAASVADLAPISGIIQRRERAHESERLLREPGNDKAAEDTGALLAYLDSRGDVADCRVAGWASAWEAA